LGANGADLTQGECAQNKDHNEHSAEAEGDAFTDVPIFHNLICFDAMAQDL
jgi:hypothetical protein